MDLLTVAGFLGSGKTTMVIRLAEAAIQKGIKPAVLVNEIGEMSIDDKLMRQLDLNVFELSGGCICCTLAANVPQTLQKLVEDYSPDFIMVEPSGAAKLESVTDALKFYKGEPLKSQNSVVLLDPLRLDILFRSLSPLITSQIQGADIILLNKADKATAEQIEISKKIVKQIDPGKPIFTITAKQGIDAKVLEELLP